jgi:hypothetical protein
VAIAADTTPGNRRGVAADLPDRAAPPRSRRERDLQSLAQDLDEQLAHFRKRPHALHILRLIKIAAPFFDHFAAQRELVLRKEDRQQLISALANLRTHLLTGDALAEVSQRLVPGARVQIDGIDRVPSTSNTTARTERSQ